ncbi:MAG: hypothetical protein HQK84_12280 [Nitrospinae bacterium]|nr:hypothetical protein [Nitrospinota bacterium]
MGKLLGCKSIELLDRLKITLVEESPVKKVKLMQFAEKNNKWVTVNNDVIVMKLPLSPSINEISKALKRLHAVTV